MSMTGSPAGEPTRVGSSIGDITAGLFAAVGIQAALLERQKTAIGAKVDVSMLDCQVAILENAIARYSATGEVPGPLGSRHPSITPFEAFRARQGYVIIAAGNDTLFRRLCRCLGRDALADDPRFASNDLRTQHCEELKGEIEPALALRSAAEWLEILEAEGIPSGPINDVAQVLTHPQVRARNMIVSVDDPIAGKVEMAGNPIKLSNHDDPTTREPGPELDGDRRAVLDELP
jgi:CoA:oxalate CoA-transferase